MLGPDVLGWVERDAAVTVLALLGLAFLLSMAGVEVDFTRLRGGVLRLACLGLAASFALAVLLGLGLRSTGRVDHGPFVAVVLAATAQSSPDCSRRRRCRSSSPRR